MIKVSEKFEIDKDNYCWILTYNYLGKDKDGNEKTQQKTTYHATLKQVAKSIINYESKECVAMSDLILMLENAEQIVEEILTEKIN